MGEIININDYRALKQREFFINLYNFLNKNINYHLDHILIELDEDFVELCIKNKIDPLCVNFFKIPIITFIVITFVNNSDIKGFFPIALHLDNDQNKCIFKNTLIKTIETLDENYCIYGNKENFELEIEKIIETGLEMILEIVPEKIILI